MITVILINFFFFGVGEKAQLGNILPVTHFNIIPGLCPPNKALEYTFKPGHIPSHSVICWREYSESSGGCSHDSRDGGGGGGGGGSGDDDDDDDDKGNKDNDWLREP